MITDDRLELGQCFDIDPTEKNGLSKLEYDKYEECMLIASVILEKRDFDLVKYRMLGFTYKDIGTIIDMSLERVRQICAVSFRNILYKYEEGLITNLELYEKMNFVQYKAKTDLEKSKLIAKAKNLLEKEARAKRKLLKIKVEREQLLNCIDI